VTCSFDNSAETWWSTVLAEMNSHIVGVKPVE
jgi:hypothetical protein